jgi:Peptidase family M28
MSVQLNQLLSHRRLAWSALCLVLLCTTLQPSFAQKKAKPSPTRPASGSSVPGSSVPRSNASTAAGMTAKAPETDPVATEPECKAHLQFFASDKLKGRMTGEAGNDEAAAYIAGHFRSLGLKTAPGMSSYMQRIEFQRTSPPASCDILLGKDTLRMGKDMLMFSGNSGMNLRSDAVYAGFGIVDSAVKRDDFAGLNVQGKIVIVKLGSDDSTKPREALSFSRKKRENALKRGAVALIELMNLNAPPLWAMLAQYNQRPLLQLKDTMPPSVPFFFVKDMDKRLTNAVESSATAKKPLSIQIRTDGMKTEAAFSQNVVAMLPGSDSTLAGEYVILSAHYDHIGVATGIGQGDSIYNGARDNGMGTTALLAAAKAFAQKPPARSLLFLAFTGEEMGLLGSRYYAQHPALPLNKAVFNMNCDGAGFNDTTSVTVLGLERTTARPMLEEAARKNGLKAVPDPAPEQNLFDRSDNVSFAAKGIPAPTFSPGFTAFDAEITKYYHQPGDEAGENFNFGYLTRYVNTYITANRLIANAKEVPHWMPNDKYEAAFQTLYAPSPLPSSSPR